MVTLLGAIQQIQVKYESPLKIQPGNQYQMKPAHPTIKNHLYRPIFQPLVLDGSEPE